MMLRRDFLLASASIASCLTPALGRAQSRPCPPPVVGAAGGNSVSTSCSAGDAEADWQRRISGPGVVWFHDFRTDNEVNNFRWTPGYKSGNDPLAVGSPYAKYVRRVAGDGITGGGCLEIVRLAGTNDGGQWWRPFSPLVGGTTSGNGRGAGQDDPGAAGSLPPLSYAPTDGGNQISGWTRGFYGHRSHWSDAAPGTFDGTEYWLQVRVKMDPNRILGGNQNITVGKLFYLTRTDRSLTSQEIVTYSGYPIGTQNYFNMYRSGSPPLDKDAPGVAVLGNQPRSGTASDRLCRFDDSGGRLTNCWYWPSGQWATIMWHVVPGTNLNGETPSSPGDPSGNGDTWIEVFAAGPGQTAFTKIWDQPSANVPWDVVGGHNALICSVYHNGANMPAQFYHRYDQIIFSRSPIPCPQV